MSGRRGFPASTCPASCWRAYGLSGLLCGIAAIMNASFELNVNAGFGSDWLLPSFIAAVLGGVALTGGEVSVAGILLAAPIL